MVSAAWGELYAYDGLNQLTSTTRGTLNGTKTGVVGSPTRTQAWDHDAVGNFDSVTTNGTAQARTANRQNEITSIGGATTPTYDANGNMTGDEAGKAFKYDAWNRLVEVRATPGGTVVAAYKYDGLGRRASDTKSGTTTDLYYSDRWQVLEERVGGVLRAQYTWSPVYVDAMIMRDRDTNADGTLDERLWVQQDANFNVTALVDGSGAVVERYAYDAFGVVSVLDASFAARGSSSYGWVYTFQGLRYDATAGLHEARNRWYSPTLGRFVTIDPIRYEAGDVNLYRFVGNSPGMGLDPLGLAPVPKWVGQSDEQKLVTDLLELMKKMTSGTCGERAAKAAKELADRLAAEHSGVGEQFIWGIIGLLLDNIEAAAVKAEKICSNAEKNRANPNSAPVPDPKPNTGPENLLKLDRTPLNTRNCLQARSKSDFNGPSLWDTTRDVMSPSKKVAGVAAGVVAGLAALESKLNPPAPPPRHLRFPDNRGPGLRAAGFFLLLSPEWLLGIDPETGEPLGA